MRVNVVGSMIAGALLFGAGAAIDSAQTPSPSSPASAAAGTMPRAADDRFAKIIQTISPERVAEIDKKLISFGSRASTSETTSTETRGVVPARKWIYEQFQAISAANGGRLKVSIDTFPVPRGNRIPADQTMSNVVAILPGTDPKDTRVFVVSGHYDSIPADFAQDAPGANDDASGTVVSLECARALAPFQFPATIMFLAVEGEEQGLHGSKHAAESAKAAGLNIVAMLNNDIVGGDQTPGRENKELLRVFSQGVPPKATPEELQRIASAGLENDSASRQVARYASAIADTYLSGFRVVLEYRTDRFQRGGDHSSFLDNGFAAVRFSEYNENSQHQHQVVREENGIEYGDVFKWVSPSYIANVARVNALTLASLASAPPAPDLVTFQGGQGPNGTAVTWTEVPGAVSYRVLLRPTAESQWSIRLPAPKVAAPARGAGGGRGGRGGSGGAATAGGDTPPTPASPPAPSVPTYQVTVPQSGDNYYIAIVSIDTAGHESLPKVGGTAPRGGARGGGQ